MTSRTERRSRVLRHLSKYLGTGHGPVPGDEKAWLAWVALANGAGVSPALWLRVRDAGAAPPASIAGYLSALHAVNEARNRKVRRLATTVAADLNTAGMVPAALKASAFLFDGQRPPGWRITSDLDLAVPPEQFEHACRILGNAGWTPVEPMAPEGHAVTLFRPGAVVPLDLHRWIGPHAALLPPADLFRDASVVVADGARIALPSPTHRLFHTFLNTQVLAPNHHSGAIALRQLLDCAAIPQPADGAAGVDWDALSAAARAHRLDRRLRVWLHMAHVLVGAPVPAAARETVAGRLHLRRALAQVDRSWLARLTRPAAVLLPYFGYWRLRLLYPRTSPPLLGIRHAYALWRRHRLDVLTLPGQQGDVF